MAGPYPHVNFILPGAQSVGPNILEAPLLAELSLLDSARLFILDQILSCKGGMMLGSFSLRYMLMTQHGKRIGIQGTVCLIDLLFKIRPNLLFLIFKAFSSALRGFAFLVLNLEAY